jgi:hypothetical protein
MKSWAAPLTLLTCLTAGFVLCEEPVSVASAPGAGDSNVSSCGNIRTDQYYHADTHGDFGAFAIVVRNAGCNLARSVAARFAYDYRVLAVMNKHPDGYVNNIEGWACTSGPTKPLKMQWAAVSCRHLQVTVTFELSIPSG